MIQISIPPLLVAIPLLAAAPAAQAQTIRAVMQTSDHGHMIYDTLFSLDETGAPQPQMVGEHTISTDKLVHTFTLRENLAWHDGRPVTAQDAVSSIKRWLGRDALGLQLATLIHAVDVMDERTFEVHLHRPTDLLIQGLAKPIDTALYILPTGIAEADPQEAITDFTGSGPFVFQETEWRPGTIMVFEKNEAYVPRLEDASGLAGGKVVKVDRVEWITMPDPQQQVNALLNGEIDYVQMPLIDLFPLLEPDPDVQLIETGWLAGQLAFRFNWLTEPFDDPQIRQAAWYALNQSDFLTSAIGNPAYYRECRSVFACGTPYETEVGMGGRLQSDYDKSKELLDQAGYDGTPVIIPQFTGLGSNVGPVAELLLERGGFNVELEWMQGEAWSERVTRKQPASAGGWSAVVRTQRGSNMLNPLDIPMLDASCETAQPGWPCDKTIEDLRTQFLQASSFEERKALSEALQQRAIEISPYVPLGQYHVPIGVRTSLEGILPAPVPVFWNISKSEG
jgi:peptide/nickel transport system substrate-binding protein